MITQHSQQRVNIDIAVYKQHKGVVAEGSNLENILHELAKNDRDMNELLKQLSRTTRHTKQTMLAEGSTVQGGVNRNGHGNHSGGNGHR